MLDTDFRRYGLFDGFLRSQEQHWGGVRTKR
jgi:hypothetical protein